MASTLLELRTQVLINLNDLQNSVTGIGDRYTSVALNSIINSAVRHYTKHLNSFYQGYLSTDLPINILANTNTYALANTFRTPIYEARRTIGTTNYYLNPIHTYNSLISTIAISNEEWVPSYHLEGMNIVFSMYPASNETAAVVLKHQTKVAALTTDVSTVNDQLYEAEDCIVLKATVQALKTKDVSGALKNISGWESELEIAERAFFTQVGNRYVKPDRPISVDDIAD